MTYLKPLIALAALAAVGLVATKTGLVGSLEHKMAAPAAAHAKEVIDNGDFAHARYDKAIELVGGDTKIFHVWDPCGVLLIFIG